MAGLLTDLDETQLKHYQAADKALKLTPEEKALYYRHLENLWGNGGVDNPDGSRSSLYQAVEQGPGGQYHNIPTVWDGAILQPDQARKKVDAVGWDKFPAYETPEQADDRYMQMHDYMNRDTGDYFAVRGPQPLLPQGLLGRGL
jgi:hypothetical protein